MLFYKVYLKSHRWNTEYTKLCGRWNHRAGQWFMEIALNLYSGSLSHALALPLRFGSQCHHCHVRKNTDPALGDPIGFEQCLCTLATELIIVLRRVYLDRETLWMELSRNCRVFFTNVSAPTADVPCHQAWPWHSSPAKIIQSFWKEPEVLSESSGDIASLQDTIVHDHEFKSSNLNSSNLNLIASNFSGTKHRMIIKTIYDQTPKPCRIASRSRRSDISHRPTQTAVKIYNNKWQFWGYLLSKKIFSTTCGGFQICVLAGYLFLSILRAHSPPNADRIEAKRASGTKHAVCIPTASCEQAMSMCAELQDTKCKRASPRIESII